MDILELRRLFTTKTTQGTVFFLLPDFHIKLPKMTFYLEAIRQWKTAYIPIPL